MNTKLEQINKLKAIINQGFAAADCREPYTNEPYPYFNEQATHIALKLLENGYGDVSKYKASVAQLEHDLADKENLNFLMLVDIERLQTENKQLKAKNDELLKKIAKLEQDLIHADENVSYRECAVSLDEDKIKKQAQIDMLATLEKEIKAHSERCYDWDIAKIIQAEVGIISNKMQKQI